MNPEVEKLLRDLAAQMGTTVEYLWVVLVKAQWVIGLTSLGLGLVGVAMFIGGLRIVRKALQNDDEADEVDGCLVGGGLLIVGAIFALVNLSDVPMRLLTPEYAALKEILK